MAPRIGNVDRLVIEPDTLRLVIGETGAFRTIAEDPGAVWRCFWPASDTTIVGLSSQETWSDEPFEVTARKQGEALVAVRFVHGGRPDSHVADSAVVLVR
jgi:hypothetical protein